MRQCSNVTSAAHSTLEADVIHFVDWLARLLHYTDVTVLVHGCYLAFESIHEVRGLRRLPSRLIKIGGGGARLCYLIYLLFCRHRVS